MSTNRPLDRGQSVLLHRVSNNITLVEKDESMGSGKNVDSLVRDSSSRGGSSNAHEVVLGTKTSDTLDQKIFLCQSTCLVEATDIKTSSKGNSEGLSTVNVELGQSS